MKRTTIMLPEELRTRALRHAHKARVSLAELIRQSLENALRRKTPGSWEEDPLFADKARAFFKGPRDLAKNHDLYLYGNEKK